MAAKADERKTNFEIVPIPDLAPDRCPCRHRVLSLSYDESLARTRDMLLSAAGVDVATYTDLQRALHACRAEDFDLIVIGHSIPTHERRKLLEEVRRSCAAPVLALQRHGDTPLLGADYVFDASQSPAQLLETVMHVLESTK